MAADTGYRQPDISLLGGEHVRRYQETGGAVGAVWNGAPVLLLTTKGRKSGRARTVPLIYAPHGEEYLVVASKGGAPTHPSWFLTVLADPTVTVQVGGEVFAAEAREATPDQKPELWAIVNQVWPNYAVYQRRTERVIPVVILSRPASPPGGR